ncbi:MAG TPA: sulfatase-like hydrolase/transferase [Gemmataceae bacterium]|nr:sulfatase-like hydrolase/transferase [Gemmataceae bacterium]
MNRTSFTSAFIMMWLAAAVAGAADPVPRRPNILFILADDQSYKTVACYPGSYPWVKTPNIDALAATGVRFERAYLGAWCMPSRASLLTGRHPHAIESMRMEGDYPGSTYDPAKCPFWPAVFRANGYHTAQIGKWHTGTDAGYGRDWDHQIVWNRPKHPKNAGNYYHDQLLAFNGREQRTDGYSTDNYTRWACDYIRGKDRPADKPWYLWLCYGTVHGPSTPAARHLGKYADAKVTPPADIFGPRPGKPKYLDLTQAWVKGPGGVPVTGKSGEKFGDESKQKPKTHEAWVQQVNECVLSLDEGIGQVMAALKESGQLENTLVVYSADQGFAMGEHGFRTKLAPYDANYASPLIVSRPGMLPKGKACPHPVNAPDLVVTFFRHAGIELPWTMHGRDITPLLQNPDMTDWQPVLYEHTGHDFGSDITRILREGGPAVYEKVPWYVAVRVGKYKYIRYLRAGEPEEVYDLAADPEELTNLAGRGEHSELRARLREAAVAELRRTEADSLPHLPAAAAVGTTRKGD